MDFNRWHKTGMLLAALLFSGCEGAIPPMDDPDTLAPGELKRLDAPEESIFGGDGIDIGSLFGFGDDKQSSGGGGGGGIGVNSFLWRATLDTFAFMPLASADPFGGVIITDWYSPPETPNERFKANVFILDRQLRANGIRVALFRQKLTDNNWMDAKVEKKTATNLENQILVRARQLRVDTNEGRN